MHIFAKIGFVANDAVTHLKMVEKGLDREDLALAVLVDFPFQILGGWLAAKWSKGDQPLRPWVWAFWPRLGFALISAIIVFYFPTPPISRGFFVFLVVHTVLQSFSSYVLCCQHRCYGITHSSGPSNLWAFLPSTIVYPIH
jgi:MFS transporter, PAT family, solute carrier family 33 (acetyl-CoA transportor), member 1